MGKIIYLILILSCTLVDAKAKVWSVSDSLDNQRFPKMICAIDSLNCLYEDSGYNPVIHGSIFNLVYTNDGGMTWNKVYSDTTFLNLQTALSLNYYSSSLCIVTRDSGVTMISRDNFKTWEYIQDDKNTISSIEIIDKNIGYKIKCLYGAAICELYYTNDGFRTWSKVDFPEQYKGIEIRNIQSNKKDGIILSATDEKLGYVGVCITNEGKDWSVLKQFSSALSNFILNDSVFFFIRNKSLLKSNDRGNTLIKLSDDSLLADALFCCFADELNGFVYNNKGKILRTSDGGASWLCEWIGNISPEQNGKTFLIINKMTHPSSNVAYFTSLHKIYKIVDGPIKVNEAIKSEDIVCFYKNNNIVVKDINNYFQNSLIDIYLYDIRGVLCFSDKINQQKHAEDLVINVGTAMSKGYYLLVLETNSVRKVVKLCIN